MSDYPFGRLMTTALRLSALWMLSVSLVMAQQNVDNHNIFETDGNPQNAASPAGEDWTSYFPAPGSGGLALRTAFVTDPDGQTTFTQGGSKDINGVSQWRQTGGSVPDKDDILHAYAAAYNVNGQLLLYFGADRFANNGDANIGFWFFQGNVGPSPSGNTFTGAHQDGDIFVVSGFTSGGQTSEITVYKWSCPGNPVNCDSVGTLVLVSQTLGGSTCIPSATGTHLACAISNTGPVDSPWPYTPKSGSADIFPIATFFEGGINVTQLLGGITPCFSTFLVETRSSTSLTAQLKDFVAGDFALCGIAITKNCSTQAPTVNSGGASVHYAFDGTVTNTGVGTVYNATIIDTLPAGAFNASFTPAGGVFATIAAGASANWSVSFDLAAVSVTNSATVKASTVSGETPGTCSVSGTICSSGAPPEATCTVAPTNTITITKNCGVPAGHVGASSPPAALPGTQLVSNGGQVAVKVNFSGQVCNTGQTPLSNATITDEPSATITSGSLASIAPGACVNYSGTYMPSAATGDGTTTAGRYSFADKIKVTGATASLGAAPSAAAACVAAGGFLANGQACAQLSCNICPQSGVGGALCSGN